MLTVDKATEEKQPHVMGNQFFGDVSHPKITKECAIMEKIRERKIDLEEQFTEAKDKYAGALLKDKYCPATYEAEFNCRMIENGLNIISQLEKDIEMMMPMSLAN